MDSGGCVRVKDKSVNNDRSGRGGSCGEHTVSWLPRGSFTWSVHRGYKNQNKPLVFVKLTGMFGQGPKIGKFQICKDPQSPEGW